MDWTTEGSEFESRTLFFMPSKRIPYVLGVYSLAVKRPGHRTDHTSN
jgi:hypothetical protein